MLVFVAARTGWLPIGGMAAHNGLDFFRKMRNRYLERRNAAGYFERLNPSERLQHFLTLSTFITLVITGFALKYKWSLPFASDAVNSIGRGLLHRVAAIIMIGPTAFGGQTGEDSRIALLSPSVQV